MKRRKQEIVRKLLPYTFSILMIGLHCLDYRRLIFSEMGEEGIMTVERCMEFFFQGTPPFSMNGIDSVFYVPTLWFSYYVLYFLICGKHSFYNKKQEQQIMLRLKKRETWWRKQELNLVIQTATYTLTTVASFIFIGVGMGMKLGSINDELLQIFLNSFLILVVFGFLQEVASLKYHPIVGVLLSISILVLSVFQLSPLLLGNYMMMIRLRLLKEMGVPFYFGAVASLLLVFVLGYVGKRIVKMKDWF